MSPHVPGIGGHGGQTQPLSFTLAGMFPGVAGGNTVTLTGHRANDLCVFFDWAVNGTAAEPSPSVPAGFSPLIYSGGAVQSRAAISAKKLDGSEGVLTGMARTSYSHVGALLFRPNMGWVGFGWNAGVSIMSGADPAAQTIAIGADTRRPLLIVGMMATVGAAVIGRVFSPLNEWAPVDGNQYVHYYPVNAGLFGSIGYDQGDSAVDNFLGAGYLSFTF